MVAYTFCAENDFACHYDRDVSVSCAQCLQRGWSCDSSFSLTEFRKVGEQKEVAESELLKKEQMIAETRRRLLELEEDGLKSKEWLQHLRDISERMLRCEMRALGVLSPRRPQDSLALGNQSLFQSLAPNLSQVNLVDLFFSDDPQRVLDFGSTSM